MVDPMMGLDTVITILWFLVIATGVGLVACAIGWIHCYGKEDGRRIMWHFMREYCYRHQGCDELITSDLCLVEGLTNTKLCNYENCPILK